TSGKTWSRTSPLVASPGLSAAFIGGTGVGGAGCAVSVRVDSAELFLGIVETLGFEFEAGLAADRASAGLELRADSAGAASECCRNNFGRARSKISTTTTAAIGRKYDLFPAASGRAGFMPETGAGRSTFGGGGTFERGTETGSILAGSFLTSLTSF